MSNKCIKMCCLILAVFVLLSGIEIEKIQGPSSFSMSSSQPIDCALMQVKDALCTPLCQVRDTKAEEIMEELRMIRILLNHRFGYYRNTELLSFLGKRFYSNLKVMFLKEHYEEILVTNYLHKLDGKKRI